MKSILMIVLKPFLSMLTKTDGWKSILDYLISEITAVLATGNPIVASAISKAFEEPSFANIIMALGQVMLAIGLLHKGVKNVGK